MKVRLVRSILLDGEPAEAGEVREIQDEELAKYLIACESAVRVGRLERVVWQVFGCDRNEHRDNKRLQDDNAALEAAPTTKGDLGE